jgi:hypothetical protein
MHARRDVGAWADRLRRIANRQWVSLALCEKCVYNAWPQVLVRIQRDNLAQLRPTGA